MTREWRRCAASMACGSCGRPIGISAVLPARGGQSAGRTGIDPSSHDIAVIWRRSASPCRAGASSTSGGAAAAPYSAVEKAEPDEPINNRGGAWSRSSARRRAAARNPAQRRDLHREVALLDDLAGPGSLDQHIFRNYRAGPPNQRMQRGGDRPPPERDRLGPTKKQVIFRVKLKRPQCMNIRHVRAPRFRESFRLKSITL